VAIILACDYLVNIYTLSNLLISDDFINKLGDAVLLETFRKYW